MKDITSSSATAKRLLVMAGGTGGHVFPALAVADCLIQQGWQVKWLGTQDRMEAQLVPEHGIEIDFIKISGLRGKKITALLLAPFRILGAVLAARKVIKRYQPNAVLGMGGYVSGPGGIAAWLCGVPIVLHEQNGVAGLTNRWLSKFAKRVLQAFPSAFPNAQVVGNPVRKALLNLPTPTQRELNRDGPFRILVVGGSQGAQVLNKVMPEVAQNMGEKVTIRHQVGKGNLSRVEMDYKEKGVLENNQVTEFIKDMSEAYLWADVVICRSGALTVSEIQAIGVAAIFVPFMHKDRQQYWNAVPLEQEGAAVIIEQPDLSAERIVIELSKRSRSQWVEMAEKARHLSISDSTEKVAQAIIDVAT